MRPRIYVSGPLTSSGDPQENMMKAVDLGRELILLGFAPFIPHLTLVVDPHAEIAHNIWMEVDLPWVRKANAVFRMPGKSSGADLEVNEAITRGIPVFTTVTEMMDYFRIGKPDD